MSGTLAVTRLTEYTVDTRYYKIPWDSKDNVRERIVELTRCKLVTEYMLHLPETA